MSVNKFHADLFWQSKFNCVTLGCSQLSFAVGNGDCAVFYGGDGDTFGFYDIGAANNGKVNRLLDANFSGLGICNLDGNINSAKDRYVVGSFLSNLFAIFAITSITTISTIPSVSTISVVAMVTISMMGLADSDHLNIGNFFKCNRNSFGGCFFIFLSILVCADFLGDYSGAYRTNCASDIVTLFNIYNDLNG